MLSFGTQPKMYWKIINFNLRFLSAFVFLEMFKLTCGQVVLRSWLLNVYCAFSTEVAFRSWLRLFMLLVLGKWLKDLDDVCLCYLFQGSHDVLRHDPALLPDPQSARRQTGEHGHKRLLSSHLQHCWHLWSQCQKVGTEFEDVCHWFIQNYCKTVCSKLGYE